MTVRRSARAARLVAALALLTATAASCSDDGSGEATTTSEREPTSTEATDRPAGEPVEDHLLQPADLPEGFAPAADADDAITSFCAGEDATAGLAASARSVAAFTRDPAGASVIQLVFRFLDDGADRFVEQADAVLDRCHAVPDFTGLAFEYEPVSPEVEAALSSTAASTARYGRSVGSGGLTIDVAVFADGEVGQLVAVLGVDLPREELDAIAVEAFSAAAARAAGAS